MMLIHFYRASHRTPHKALRILVALQVPQDALRNHPAPQANMALPGALPQAAQADLPFVPLSSR